MLSNLHITIFTILYLEKKHNISKLLFYVKLHFQSGLKSRMLSLYSNLYGSHRGLGKELVFLDIKSIFS